MAARTIALPCPSQPARRKPALLARLLDWFALYRQRQHLANLPDHLLKDIGLSREDAATEAKRPLWDAPDHWTQ